MMSLKEFARSAYFHGAGVRSDSPEQYIDLVAEEFELWWQERGYDNIEIP